MKRFATEPTRTPNPQVSLPLVSEEGADLVRRLHCRNYDGCLAVAIERGWEGFSCGQCQAFEARTGEEEAWDGKGHLQLAAEVLYGVPGADGRERGAAQGRRARRCTGGQPYGLRRTQWNTGRW